MNKIFSLFFIICFITFSCSDSNTIGLEVQPPSDNIVISSLTFPGLTSIVESEDSLRSDEAVNLILGEMNDPVFGNSISSFYTQILLSQNNTDLGSNPIVDSVVLSYTYSGSYGDEILDFTSLDVLVVEDDIYKDSVYYSTSYTTPVPGGMSYAESFSISEDTEKPTLKINLSNEFGQDILDLTNDGLVDNQIFLDNFKGISVFASAENTMLYLNPNGSNSFLKIYYSNEENGNDTLSLDFDLGGDAARINLFNPKSIYDLIQDSNNMYIQSMAGYKTKILAGDLPILRDTLKGKSINKVTMSFNIEQGSQNEYQSHEKLVLVRVNEDGNNVFLSDFTVEGEAYFGGVLNDGKYVFTITRYFYQLLNNQSFTNELYLLPAGAVINANRTILSKDIELNIYYSEL